MRRIEKVSVVVVVYNEAWYIEWCIKAVLEQTYPAFELIIIDDCSTDRTRDIVKSFSDGRIAYFQNGTRKGIAYSRNQGIQHSTTEYVFFVDADCVPIKYWLEEGVRAFEQKSCLGVEGRTSYETAQTSLADRIIENTRGGAYNTCNIGYVKSALLDAGRFNEDYKWVSEDTDLARKILLRGSIEFLPSMVVFHSQKKLTPGRCFEEARRVFSKVKYIKNTGDLRACCGRIMYPAHLCYLFFPPLLLLRYRFKNLQEIFLLFVIYISYIV